MAAASSQSLWPLHSFGRYLRERHGARVHKLAINAAFTCPNRDGSKGLGGCTFCNNASFSPNAKSLESVTAQVQQGKAVVRRRLGAQRFIAYFQAYTNTYAPVQDLRRLYDEALADPDIIGLSIGTRPDCVPDAVLDLLCEYRDKGKEIWLELGLQSAFEVSLQRVNRGHGLAEYRDAMRRAQRRGLNVCTHLMVGLPGERAMDSVQSFRVALDCGTQGVKVHPLHVVKGTQLARDWHQGRYQPLSQADYVATVAAMVRVAPPQLVWHRLTGTAPAELLLAPLWCGSKWPVLNAIQAALSGSDSHAQGQSETALLQSSSPLSPRFSC